MAVLSKAGCNRGTCHGNANGKGGFRLSLRGQNPEADFQTLTHSAAQRRITALNPDDSLLLKKPLMQVPHEGGQQLTMDSVEHQILRRWIEAGTPDDPAGSASVISIRVSPMHRLVEFPLNSAQLTVNATFSDGSTRDVTALTVFESSSLHVEIDRSGLATASRPCLTTVTARYLNQQVPVRLEFIAHQPDFAFTAPPVANFIDEAVFSQLQRLKVNPTAVCDDITFLRRVCLDLTGLLPSAQQTQAFLQSTAADKRAKLIDELLASDSFNDFQALRWADLLRVEDKTLDETGVSVFHGWIRTSFAENRPLNDFCADMIEAKGSTYKVPATNFYRALRTSEERAEAAAQLFLGVRLQCAKCHNHPFDQWTQDDYYGWSNFFARIDYEIVENKRRDSNDKHEFAGEQIVKITDKGDVRNPTTGKPASLRFLGNSGDADPEAVTAGDPAPDRLQRLGEWLRSPDNERFAATQANRIWAQLFGRGLVDPVDDFRTTNPPVNPELLTLLTQEFVAHDFDVRHLMRIILNSNTYQLAGSSEEDEIAATCFAVTVPRRLTAEQALDGICSVLNVPAAFGGHPQGTKAVQLTGVRNGGHRYSKPDVGDRFLKLFGKPNRLQSCECERSGEPTLAQTFEMISGELINEMLKNPGNRIRLQLAEKTPPMEIVSQLYQAALSRPPSADEQSAIEKHMQQTADPVRSLEDIAWALLNSNEFLIRR
ncbi:MAG: DUF1549 and DUF1553 domain-containing protein [Planctomycetaceae bacterium]